ncbi:MAG: hypothetical protein GX590_05485 [Lentisphaerae bacterium]|nr:hypothetical protein [Lentisphaerota bacterium]
MRCCTWSRSCGLVIMLYTLLLSAAAQAQQGAGRTGKPGAAESLQAELNTVNQLEDRQCLVLRKQYLSALQTTRVKQQAAGDLNGVLALDAEIARVEDAGWRTNTLASPPHEALGELPDKWALALTDIAAQARTARLAVYERHIQALDAQIRELVRVGKIEPAKTVDEERKILVAGRDALAPPPGDLMRAAETGARESTPAGASGSQTRAHVERGGVRASPPWESSRTSPPDKAPDAPDNPPAIPADAAATEHVLNLTFDGSDLPTCRREGTGKLVERNGRLMVEHFGTNTRLKPHFGMRLRAPVLHRGDFTLRSCVTLNGAENQRGLIRLTALFSNRSEAVCEVRADNHFNGMVIARAMGQADQVKPIRLSGGYSYYYDNIERIYMNTRDLPLIIARKGTELTLLAGPTEIGRATLAAETTALTGVAIDIERSRDKNTAPTEMWVESLELIP